MTLKQRIFELIDEKAGKRIKWHQYFDIAIICLIVLSVIEIILESYQSINQPFSPSNKKNRIFLSIDATLQI